MIEYLLCSIPVCTGVCHGILVCTVKWVGVYVCTYIAAYTRIFCGSCAKNSYVEAHLTVNVCSFPLVCVVSG